MKHLTLVATVLLFANSALAQMGTPLYSLQEKMERFEHDLILLQQRVYKGHIISDDKETTVSNEQADDLLNKEQPVAVYCRSGRRSRTAADLLVKKGYKVYNLDKGILNWIEEGREIEK